MVRCLQLRYRSVITALVTICYRKYSSNILSTFRKRLSIVPGERFPEVSQGMAVLATQAHLVVSSKLTRDTQGSNMLVEQPELNITWIHSTTQVQLA